MNEPSAANHGEGDPEAAERFNSAERKFVESPAGRQRIQQGAQVRADEEAALANAEEQGRARSKGDQSTCLDGM